MALGAAPGGAARAGPSPVGPVPHQSRITRWRGQVEPENFPETGGRPRGTRSRDASSEHHAGGAREESVTRPCRPLRRRRMEDEATAGKRVEIQGAGTPAAPSCDAAAFAHLSRHPRSLATNPAAPTPFSASISIVGILDFEYVAVLGAGRASYGKRGLVCPSKPPASFRHHNAAVSSFLSQSIPLTRESGL